MHHFYVMGGGGPFTHLYQATPNTNVQDYTSERDIKYCYLGNISVEERYEQRF